jgi:hypothetical protein
VPWTLVATTVALGLAGLTWIADVNARGLPPGGDFEPREWQVWTFAGPDAETLRRDTFRRAVFDLDSAADAAHLDAPVSAGFRREAQRPAPAESGFSRNDHAAGDALPTCRFLPSPPSGTSAKFDCVFDGGDVVKVKYGRNPEINAEVAASRLLTMLGYPADRMTIVPRLRCYGCPRFPFLATSLSHILSLPLLPDSADEGYTDFEWVSVEHKFPAPAIETDSRKGWAWWELEHSGAPRADVDALRLTAIFLAHWDNKDENQRLVCLDGPPPAVNAPCARPLALIQDVGATFGPSKVNLARWRTMPVWKDRHTCTVSMRAFPFEGASFPDARITEAGRARLANRLAALDDETIARLFREARFPQFQAGTDDAGDLAAWTEAFRHRAGQILTARCPEAS